MEGELNSDKAILQSNMKKTTISNSIKTFCRLRPNSTASPLINYSIANDSLTLIINEEPLPKSGPGLVPNNINTRKQPKTNTQKQELSTKYSFTKVFEENTKQQKVFTEICRPMIDDLVSFKRSSLIFAYGLSNSGKTYTIIGNMETPGILPLSLIAILEEARASNERGEDKKTIECSYVEIYNEEIFDLLSVNKTKVHLKEKEKIFHLVDTTVKQIESIEDFNLALNDGIMRKIHSSTKLNPLSSRSHTIFKIVIKGRNSKEASFSIVDLAGAERSVRAETKGKELYQAGKINQSLMILGRCIDAMEWNTRFVNGDKKIPVPIRESKLTKMFQEYFTGEHNVSMITTMSTSKEDLPENKAVLSYSCKAKKIQPLKSWVSIRSKAKDENKENMGISMLMTGYNSDVSSDMIENNKPGVNANEEQYTFIKDQYSSLVKRYETSIDEVDYLQDKNDLLVNTIRNLEKDYAAREYNAIISRGQQFLLGTWNNISQFRSNFFQNKSKEKEKFVINNPLYKKEFEEKARDQYETFNENIEIIQEMRKVKTFKEIADSFTIMSDNIHVKNQKGKKNNIRSKATQKKKGYLTSTSAIDEEDTEVQVDKAKESSGESEEIIFSTKQLTVSKDNDVSMEIDVGKVKKKKRGKDKKKEKEREMEIENERERERETEIEGQRDMEIQKEKEKEKQNEKERKREREMEKEKEKKKDRKRERAKEKERQRQEEIERQRQEEMERQKQAEIERQRNEEIERQREEEMEIEKQRQKALEKKKERGKKPSKKAKKYEKEKSESFDDKMNEEDEENYALRKYSKKDNKKRTKSKKEEEPKSNSDSEESNNTSIILSDKKEPKAKKKNTKSKHTTLSFNDSSPRMKKPNSIDLNSSISPIAKVFDSDQEEESGAKPKKSKAKSKKTKTKKKY